MPVNTLRSGLMAMGLLISAASGNAALRTFDFEIQLTTGLHVGEALTGYVTIDDTGVPLGPPGVNRTDLLTDLSFAYDGTLFDETTANSSFIELNLDESLDTLVFGSNCFLSGCSAPEGDWIVILGGPPTNAWDFAGWRVGDPAFGELGDVSFSQRIPEPGTLAVVGLGLAGLAALRRRKQ